MKLIASYVCNAISFFLNQDKEKKEVTKIFKTHFPYEFQQVKNELFECLILIPSHLYSQKFVGILHSVCEEIVSDEILTIPSSFKKCIHFEDLAIGKENQVLFQFQA